MLRLYVRGWVQPITEDDIRKRFEGLPGILGVSNIALNSKKFAHVNLEISTDKEQVMTKLKSIYKNAKWKGGILEFDISKPEYKQRLQEEKLKQALEAQQKSGLTQNNVTSTSYASFASPSKAEQNNLSVIQSSPSYVVANPPSNQQNENLLTNLRIRGCGKKPKRARIIEFNNDDDDDEVNISLFDQVLGRKIKLPISQDPAYCCTTGDAGASKPGSNTEEVTKQRAHQTSKMVDTVEIVKAAETHTKNRADTVEPAENQTIKRVSEKVLPEREIDTSAQSKPRIIEVDSLPQLYKKDNEEDEHTASKLSEFVKLHHPNDWKPKKNASKSLLGMWFVTKPKETDEQL
jgi:hypothetical protein